MTRAIRDSVGSVAVVCGALAAISIGALASCAQHSDATVIRQPIEFTVIGEPVRSVAMYEVPAGSNSWTLRFCDCDQDCEALEVGSIDAAFERIRKEVGY